MTVSVCGRSSEIHGSIGKAWGRFTREGITAASATASSSTGGLGSRSAGLRSRRLLTERDDRHRKQQGTRPGQKQELTGQTGSHRRPPEKLRGDAFARSRVESFAVNGNVATVEFVASVLRHRAVEADDHSDLQNVS